MEQYSFHNGNTALYTVYITVFKPTCHSSRSLHENRRPDVEVVLLT